MTKYYCDKCGAGGKSAVLSSRFRFKKGRMEAELLLCTKGVWNAGLLCKKCAIELVKTGKSIEPTYGS